MKTIPLTQGKVALVDDADFEWLSQFKWHAHLKRRKSTDNWYAIRSDQKRMHRLMMGCMADHRNGNGLDNRRANLRPCSYELNNANIMLYKSVTGLKGVSKSDRGSFVSQISCSGKKKLLGRFAIPEDAARAYDRAAVERWGEFACINFPEDFPHLNLRCARHGVEAA